MAEIPGRLHTTAADGIVVVAQEIEDTNLQQKQNVINTKVFNTEASLGYTTCNVAANVAAKTVTLSNFALPIAGGSVKIKFTYANTADNPTLTFNNDSSTTKALWYADAIASSTNSWEEGETVEIYYDGTKYIANNVQGGGGLLNEDTIPSSEQASTKKGLTEYSIAKAVENLQDSIDNVAITSTVISLAQQSGTYSTSTIREIKTAGSTEKIPLYATSIPAKTLVELQLAKNGSGYTKVGVEDIDGNENPIETKNTNTDFYYTAIADAPARYAFRATTSTPNVRSATSGVITIDYCNYFYYGFVLNSQLEDEITGELTAAQYNPTSPDFILRKPNNTLYNTITSISCVYTVPSAEQDVDVLGHVYIMVPEYYNGVYIPSKIRYGSADTGDIPRDNTFSQTVDTEVLSGGYKIYRIEQENLKNLTGNRSFTIYR